MLKGLSNPPRYRGGFTLLNLKRSTLRNIAIVLILTLAFLAFVQAQTPPPAAPGILARILHIIGQILALDGLIKLYEDTIGALTLTIDDLQKKQDGATWRWGQAQDEVRDLQGRIDTANDTLAGWENDYNSKLEEEDLLLQEIEDAISPSRIDELEADLRALRSEISDLDVKIRLKRDGINRLLRLKGRAQDKMERESENIERYKRKKENKIKEKQQKEDKLRQYRDDHQDWLDKKSEAEQDYYDATGTRWDDAR